MGTKFVESVGILPPNQHGFRSKHSTMSAWAEMQNKVQNKMFRLLNNTRIKDKISTKSIMANLNMLSVNQVNAQVKITEIWKSRNVENYPIHIQKLN